MSAFEIRAVCCGVLLVGVVTGCSKNRRGGDTATAMGAIPPDTAPAVAVTTEIAPGVLMTAQAGPGTGLVLVDGAGRSMYVLDTTPTDTNTWRPVSGGKPLTTTDTNIKTSLIGTTTSASGTKQATYNGKPLYYYQGDSSPNDRKGEGVTASGATGHLVKVNGNSKKPGKT
jgi:predicted lipoprotein with Yx(FWY)xxD motif